MDQLFGTDGIRGTPGIYPLTDEMIAKIGKGIAQFVFLKKGVKAKAKVVIGKDTRLSGSHIENILADNISSLGIDVLLVNIITTPGLSFLVKELNANMGIMISASHNKSTDNGIKLFGSKCHKLSTEEEEWIENAVLGRSIKDSTVSHHKGRGKISKVKAAPSKYVKFLTSTVEGLNLKGVRVALDCASGAASPFAKKVFAKLGAEIYSIHDTPSGDNINVSGALNPSFLKKLVLDSRAHIGIALDGDGDRGILLDEKGNILDGDYIIAVMAQYLIKKDKLPKNSIVTTVMSNYGLKIFLENIGVKSILTKVGDKYVLEALLKHNLNLGGEQSGHIIFLDHLPTPDGLLTALQMLRVMKETRSNLSELSKCITKLPQVLVNVKVKEKRPFEELPLVNERLKYFDAQLKDKGRILLRYSGTEPLARVMVEGFNQEVINKIANSLAEHIRQEIGVEEAIDHRL